MSIGKIQHFDYYVPDSLDEALEFLDEKREHVKILAGGTDVVPKMKGQVIHPAYVMSLKKLSELKEISYEEGKALSFGAMAVIKEIEDFEPVREQFTALYEGAHSIASTQIRNMGTVVGNICNAVPSADSAPALLVLDAVVKITGKDEVREVPIHQFFTGVCRTVVKENELVTAVELPCLPPKSGSSYLAFTVRRALDLAMAGAATRLTLDDENRCTEVRISLGAVAPTPVRAVHAEEVIKGKIFSDDLVDEAAKIASEKDCSPITDMRATKEYRRAIVKALVKDSLKISFIRSKQR
ncbi:MAG: xanthine dehydrogenase family protein subunit M [Muricomes sp.]|uniref:FAD binding domain-containing protein n=1 Tax=Faecalicatena contorta TaxID=39482 RepID=UPI002EC2496C|nr:xanthine dehydrogenase family protein subunit M [Muricomes sp.]